MAGCYSTLSFIVTKFYVVFPEDAKKTGQPSPSTAKKNKNKNKLKWTVH